MANRLKGVKSSPNLIELINKKQESKDLSLSTFVLRPTSASQSQKAPITIKNNEPKSKDDSDIESFSKKNININYTDVIRRLIAKEPNTLNNQLLLEIFEKVTPIFKSEPQLLEIPAPVFICGDIHGQFDDLLKIFRNIGYPPKEKILFLGDYVDRGDASIEVIALLFLLKIKFPKHIFMTRGNHECHTINRMYGFYEECQRKANLLVWKACNQVFTFLPLAALVDNKIFCVHGGLSPKLNNIRDINQIRKGTKIPDSGVLCDLMWSDPGEHKEDWVQNDRGCSYTFGEKVVKQFLASNNIDLICRGHQVVNGYEFSFANKLVTVFSAPNYCNEYANAASVMKVESDLTCSFIILRPVAYLPKGGKKVSLNNHVN